MSLNTSKQFHSEFLSRYFALPTPDRTQPYAHAGVRGAKDFSEGFPDECVVDHLFTPKADVDAARFRLLHTYLATNLEIGWLNIEKKPVTSEKQCGHKQGFCRDFDFLVSLYNSRRQGDIKWQPEFLGFHTNIGVAPFVIDLDFKPGLGVDACQTFFEFLEKNGIDPCTLPAVYTPGGGLHIYFRHYEGEHVSRANFATQVWGCGVDVRGNGALVLGAGSFAWMPDGSFRQYMVLNSTPLPPLPVCIVEVIEDYNKSKTQFSVPSAVEGEYTFDSGTQIDIACRIVATRQEGERNTILNGMSFAMGKLIRDGKEEEDNVREKLLQAALQTGLGKAEILNTINSGINAGKTSDQPYEPFKENHGSTAETSAEKSAEPASVSPSEPSVRKAPTSPFTGNPPAAKKPDNEKEKEKKTKEVKDREYLAQCEQADLTYNPGNLSRFAQRHGTLDETRVDAIAKEIFPTQIYDYLHDLRRLYDMDYKSLVQYMATVPCQTVKGARRMAITLNANTMPANLFVNVMGDPASGKSRLAHTLLGPLERRQKADFRAFKDKWEDYKRKKREWDRSKKKDEPEPVPPVLHSSIIHDATTEALISRAESNPQGLFLFSDEGAGQATFGAGRYLKGSEARTIGVFIVGYDGGTVINDRKNSNGEQRVEGVDNFTLAYTMNVQDELVPRTFTEDLDIQGYTPRFVHIHVPPQPDGWMGSNFRLDVEECAPRLDFYESVINKLLDMCPRGDYGGILYLTRDALKVHDDWCRAITGQFNYGKLKKTIIRFCQTIVPRIAMGLHFLHIACKCVEADQSKAEKGNVEEDTRMAIVDWENEHSQYIEKEDMERAVMVSDLFLLGLDVFLWLRNKPTNYGKSWLTRDEQSLAKFVISNSEFFRTPRSAKEIIEEGFPTDKNVNEFCIWLQSIGVPLVKNGSKAAKRVKKFDLRNLKMWGNAVDFARMAFPVEDDSVPVATAICKAWEVLKANDLTMPVDEFTACLDSEDREQLVESLVKDARFGVEVKDSKLVFPENAIDVAKRILTTEGYIMDGKPVGCAA